MKGGLALLLGGALKDAPFPTNFFFMEGKDACLDDVEMVAHKLHSSSPRSSKEQRKRQTSRERGQGKERVTRSKKEMKEMRKKDMDISCPEFYFIFF